MTSWTPTDEQVEAAKLAAIQRSDGDEDSWDADIRAALQGAGELIRREVAASLRSAYATRLAALGEEHRTKPDPNWPGRCPSIDPDDTLQCTRKVHGDDACRSGGIAWRKGEPRHVGARERVALLERLIDEVAGRDS